MGRNSLVNGTIMRHLGTRENFSDVRAKLEASGRILALVSLPLGIWIFKLAGPDAPSLLGLYASIFALHNFACYKAAQQVSVRVVWRPTPARPMRRRRLTKATVRSLR